MEQIQRKIERMQSGDVAAIIEGLNSGNDYLTINAVLSSASRKITDAAVIKGIEQARNSTAILLGVPLGSVAEAAYVFLTGRKYEGDDTLVKSLIASGFR